MRRREGSTNARLCQPGASIAGLSQSRSQLAEDNPASITGGLPLSSPLHKPLLGLAPCSTRCIRISGKGLMVAGEEPGLGCNSGQRKIPRPRRRQSRQPVRLRGDGRDTVLTPGQSLTLGSAGKVVISGRGESSEVTVRWA